MLSFAVIAVIIDITIITVNWCREHLLAHTFLRLKRNWQTHGHSEKVDPVDPMEARPRLALLARAGSGDDGRGIASAVAFAYP